MAELKKPNMKLKADVKPSRETVARGGNSKSDRGILLGKAARLVRMTGER